MKIALKNLEFTYLLPHVRTSRKVDVCVVISDKRNTYRLVWLLTSTRKFCLLFLWSCWMGGHTGIQPLSKFGQLICTITLSMSVIGLAKLFILDNWHDPEKPNLTLRKCSYNRRSSCVVNINFMFIKCRMCSVTKKNQTYFY